MGQGCAKSTPESQLDAAIQRKNKKEFDEYQNEAKFLLLGPGESGKSAMFKQIKALYGIADASTQWKAVIESNIVEFAKALLQECSETGVPFDPQAQAIVDLTQDSTISLSAPLPNSATVGSIIKALWADPNVRKSFDNRRADLQINEAHVAFMNKIDKILQPSFKPDQTDIVLARVRTTGVHSERFVIEGKHFALFDVGGQRNERRKWIHVFDNVSGIIFVVGLSDYNLKCFEDQSRNRLVDALDLFDNITRQEWFTETPMVLFLNKADLFEGKLSAFPINQVAEFADYAGGATFETACEYFATRFQKLIKGQDLFTHITVATHPSNVRTVFEAARHSIVSANLKRSGLY